MDGRRVTAGGRVVVGGAINTDLVGRTARYPRQGETVTGTSFAMFGGGKGGNQAVAAVRSGANVSIVGGVGDDAFGYDRLADLVGDGIDTTAVQRIAGVSSGVALIEVEDGGDNRILYVPGATLVVEPGWAVAALGPEPIAVLLLTLELGPLVIDALLDRARRDGATVVLNATPEPKRAVVLLGQIGVLIVNESEALALAGDDGIENTAVHDWAAIAGTLRDRGATAVLITLGGQGALWVDAHGATSVPAPPVEVVDTTGAGDSLCGAFAAAIALGEPWAQAVRLGVAAGSLACTVAGAQPSVPTRAAIDRLLSRPGGMTEPWPEKRRVVDGQTGDPSSGR